MQHIRTSYKFYKYNYLTLYHIQITCCHLLNKKMFYNLRYTIRNKRRDLYAKNYFMGAGSSVFAKNVLGDCMMSLALQNSDIALFDIDPQRLKDSENMLNNINKNNGGHANITAYSDRRKALESANYVVNAIQVGGYEPCTVTDFEIPKKYGLRQTIADTLGVGGIFRALRTIPVMQMFAENIETYCPDAMFLNYTNPMGILTGYMLRYTRVNLVGLCHSVQVCVPKLFKGLGMEYDDTLQWKIAGINHMAWLLEITRGK